MIALVLLALTSGGGLGNNVSMTALAKAGAQVFSVIAYGQVILICLLAPMFMAGAIAAEQAAKTFDIMLTTPLTNLQIVFGSLTGRLYFVLALLASGLPLFSILLIFGGVPVSAVFVSFATAGLSAILMGATAVTLSVMRFGGRKAVVVFVITTAGYLVAGYVLDRLLLRRFPIVPQGTTWLTAMHPILVLESYLNQANYHAPDPEQLTSYGSLAKFYLTKPFAFFAIWTTALSFFMMAACSIWVRQMGQGPSRVRVVLKRILRLGRQPGETRTRPPRHVWANPIAWREASTRGKVAAGILGRWAFVLLGLGAAIALLWMYHTHRLPTLGTTTGGEVFRNALVTLLMMELAVISLVALYMSASCVSREREDASLDLILSTPITPKQYVWGKLRGLVSFLSVMLTVPILTMVMVSLYTWIGQHYQWATAVVPYRVNQATAHYPLLLIETPVLLTMMLLPFIAFCVIIGMTWSIKSKGVLSAVIGAVGIVATVAVVMGFCGFNAAQNIPVIGPLLNSFSPVTNLLMLINPWETIDGFLQQPTPGRWNLFAGALAAGAGYSIAVYLMLLNMIKNFNQTVRKLSGTA